MAVAGLHNLSAFGPFFGESQSRQWGEEPGTPSTRASSLLQMWRELEGDHVVSPSPRLRGLRSDSMSENVDESENQVITGSETDHDDNNGIVSEHSSDLGEIERERVRQIFREWMNSGSVGHSSNGLHPNSRSGPQWLANLEIGARRPIRRLCGRQMLLDLIQRAQCDRKGEIHGLLEQRPVSDFSHRNRIQAFLRGRFLRNERVILSERPSSVAATELGLLRQRHTVSGLREGFLSKLENSASTTANSADSDSLFGDPSNGVSESTHLESEVTAVDSGIDDDENRSQQEFVREVSQEEVPVLPVEGNDQEMYLENDGREQEMPSDIEGVQQEVSLDVRSDHGTEIANEMPLETEDINQSGPHELPLETEDINRVRPHESRLETDYIIPSGTHELPLQTDDINQSGPQGSEMAIQDQARQELTSVTHTELANSNGESITGNWQESSANELFPEASEIDAIEQDQIQESHEVWPSHDLQEAIDSWLDMPSGERRIDTLYFSDDDNVHSMEIQELFSRRRVSGLLRSSFRESLDQVLQSHVERQGNASGEWELDNASSSPSLEQDQGQRNGYHALDLSDAAGGNPFAPNPFDPSIAFVTSSLPLWDEEMQGTSLPHNNLSNQHLGTEWEVVNELRVDMARLQQRLNNMQSMLEQCMDMQIELQRSVRQEVSAALNRSILTRDESKGITIYDESQWEYVRRGICCLCRDSNIDSLLYRCGHMCACSKCADKLIQDTEKCPMCRAPVVEAVRAYFIQ